MTSVDLIFRDLTVQQSFKSVEPKDRISAFEQITTACQDDFSLPPSKCASIIKQLMEASTSGNLQVIIAGVNAIRNLLIKLQSPFQDKGKFLIEFLMGLFKILCEDLQNVIFETFNALNQFGVGQEDEKFDYTMYYDYISIDQPYENVRLNTLQYIISESDNFTIEMVHDLLMTDKFNSCCLDTSIYVQEAIIELVGGFVQKFPNDKENIVNECPPKVQRKVESKMALNNDSTASPSKFKYRDSDAMREITKYHAIITARAANWAVMKQAYIDCGLLLQTQKFSPNLPTVIVNLLKAAKNKLETDKNANLQLILLEFVGYLGRSCTTNIIQYNHIIMPTLMAFTNSKQRQFITVLYNTLDSWCHYEDGMKDYSIFNSIMPYICNAINMTNNKYDILRWLLKYSKHLKEKLVDTTRHVAKVLIHNSEQTRDVASDVMACLIPRVTKDLIVNIADSSAAIKEKLYWVYKDNDINPIPFKYNSLKVKQRRGKGEKQQQPEDVTEMNKTKSDTAKKARKSRLNKSLRKKKTSGGLRAEEKEPNVTTFSLCSKDEKYERLSHLKFYPDYYTGEVSDTEIDEEEEYNRQYYGLPERKKHIHVYTIYKKMKPFVPTKFFELVTRKIVRDVDYFSAYDILLEGRNDIRNAHNYASILDIILYIFKSAISKKSYTVPNIKTMKTLTDITMFLYDIRYQMLDEEWDIIYKPILDSIFSNKKKDVRQSGREAICHISLIYSRDVIFQSLIETIQEYVTRMQRRECLNTIRDLFMISVEDKDIEPIQQIVMAYLHKKAYRPTCIDILRLIYQFCKMDLSDFLQYFPDLENDEHTLMLVQNPDIEVEDVDIEDENSFEQDVEDDQRKYSPNEDEYEEPPAEESEELVNQEIPKEKEERSRSTASNRSVSSKMADYRFDVNTSIQEVDESMPPEEELEQELPDEDYYTKLYNDLITQFDIILDKYSILCFPGSLATKEPKPYNKTTKLMQDLLTICDYPNIPTTFDINRIIEKLLNILIVARGKTVIPLTEMDVAMIYNVTLCLSTILNNELFISEVSDNNKSQLFKHLIATITYPPMADEQVEKYKGYIHGLISHITHIYTGQEVLKAIINMLLKLEPEGIEYEAQFALINKIINRLVYTERHNNNEPFASYELIPTLKLYSQLFICRTWKTYSKLMYNTFYLLLCEICYAKVDEITEEVYTVNGRMFGDLLKSLSEQHEFGEEYFITMFDIIREEIDKVRDYVIPYSSHLRMMCGYIKEHPDIDVNSYLDEYNEEQKEILQNELINNGVKININIDEQEQEKHYQQQKQQNNKSENQQEDGEEEEEEEEQYYNEEDVDPEVNQQSPEFQTTIIHPEAENDEEELVVKREIVEADTSAPPPPQEEEEEQQPEEQPEQNEQNEEEKPQEPEVDEFAEPEDQQEEPAPEPLDVDQPPTIKGDSVLSDEENNQEVHNEQEEDPLSGNVDENMLDSDDDI